jgi:hypothetical protein
MVDWSSGFETNDYSEFSGTDGTPTIVGTAHHGSYASEGDASTDRAYITLADANHMYIKFHARIDALPGNSANKIVLMMVKNNESNTVSEVSVRGNGSGTDVFMLKYRSAGSLLESADSVQVVVDTWYCLECEVDCSTNDGDLDGSYELKVNGSAVITKNNIDTDYTNIDRYYFGSVWDNYTVTSIVDCCVVDSSSIGCSDSLFSSAIPVFSHHYSRINKIIRG